MGKKLSLLFIFLSIVISIPVFAGGGGGGSKWGSPDDDPYVPPNYSYEDLRQFVRSCDFYYANRNKPLTARVDLGYSNFYPASAGGTNTVISTISLDPDMYGVNSKKILTRWDPYAPEFYFDWTGFSGSGGRKGDLVFTRGKSKLHELVGMFSQWTHVAFAEDAARRLVFESTPNTGVKYNDTNVSWGPITYNTCKRIEMLSRDEISIIVDMGSSQYTGLPYFPGVSINEPLSLFGFKWMDKNDRDSMYCSKLVWNMLKPYIDVDTNNTSTFDDKIKDRALFAPAFSWIGVSPDDIYYSDYLGFDFYYSQNIN